MLAPYPIYLQEFWIADVTSPMLGTDFFAKYNLSLDIKKRLLIGQNENEIMDKESYYLLCTILTITYT